MRGLLVLLLSFFVACNGAITDQGFTSKAEAKNYLLDSLKVGKWVEYLDSNLVITNEKKAPYYSLTIYKLGKPYGIKRTYKESGKLYIEAPYSDSLLNGVMKYYYESGKVAFEVPYLNGKKNGTVKGYYENGKLKIETPFTNDRINGVCNVYYTDGKLKTELTYTNGVTGAIKNYDENGNEIK